jgi:hypothetical protein
MEEMVADEVLPLPGGPPGDPLVVREAHAAAAFECRWLMSSLARVDPELHGDLLEQRSFWAQARVAGDAQEVIEQGEAMIRGWQAAVARMLQAGAPDDAYVLGQHGSMTVAVGAARNGHARVCELGGQRVVWLTPDEVAQLYAGLQMIGKIQELWPDAKVVRVVEKYPDEPARED